MAYQVVLYDESGVIVDVIKPIEKVTVKGNDLSWEGGGLNGVKLNFIVIDAEIEAGDVGSVLDQSVINQDQKENLKSEYDRLREDIATLQDVINYLLGL
jgi:hypothetical protein